MKYVAVTYLAINEYGTPLVTAGTFDNLKKALDEYYGIGRDKSECIGFFPYITKYPDEYEGYYQYKYESKVRDFKTGEFITETQTEKIKVYCIVFYPYTLVDENGYPLIEGTMNLCEDIIEKGEFNKVVKLAEEEWEGCDGCDDNDKYFWIKGFHAGYNRATPIEISDEGIDNSVVKEYENAGEEKVFPNFTNKDIWMNGFYDGAKWYREQIKQRQ
jgi:hypothetical protein